MSSSALINETNPVRPVAGGGDDVQMAYLQEIIDQIY